MTTGRVQQFFFGARRRVFKHHRRAQKSQFFRQNTNRSIYLRYTESKHHTAPRCPSGLYSIGFIVHSFLTVRQCFLEEYQGQRDRNTHGHIHQQCTTTDAFAFHRHLCHNGTNNSNDVQQNTVGVGKTRNKDNRSTGEQENRKTEEQK